MWRRKADEAYRMAQGKEVLSAARNKRGYRTEFYNPGDLVYFWKEGATAGGSRVRGGIGRGGRIFFGIFSGDLDLRGCRGGLCGLGLGLLDGLPLLVMRWRLAVVAPLRRVLVVRLDDLEVALGRLGRLALLKCHGNQHKSQSGDKISSRSID